MSPASYLITALAAASLAFGATIPTCKPSSTLLAQTIPAGQSVLTVTQDPTSFILLGVGYQNYTCGTAGTYASAGATADLFDISCMAKSTASSSSIADMSYKLWTKCSKIADLFVPALGAMTASGKHFFSPSPSGTGTNPVWDMRSFGPAKLKGNPDAFVLAAKTGNIPDPVDSKTNVDWLQLKNVQGKLATAIYRVDTRGGVAPASCTPGESTRVKYTSVYFLAGSQV